MPREIIDTPNAPRGGGSQIFSQGVALNSQIFSQAVKAAGPVFVSGQAPIDPATGEMVDGTIEEQTRQYLANVQAILVAAGSSMDKLVATVVLRDSDDFAGMNAEWRRWFPQHPPARREPECQSTFVPVSFAVIAEA